MYMNKILRSWFLSFMLIATIHSSTAIGAVKLEITLSTNRAAILYWPASSTSYALLSATNVALTN